MATVNGLVIPTTFTAYDRFTAPLRTMNSALISFTNTSTVANANAVRNFSRIGSVVGDTTSQLLSFAKGAAVATGVISILTFGAKSIMDYETAVASFRTIVSDLSDKDFAKFRVQIGLVADDTKKSTVDVARSFETIAGLNSDFAKTAEGLGLVSSAAITLAKASRMDLQPASENLVGIMNQFHFSAAQADKTINALAAGQAVGAASISQTALALNNFGASAFNANVTLEQSIGLIQTLAKQGQIGADAGDKLKTSLIRIQETGFGYKTGKFQIVDALEEIKKKYDQLSTAQAKDKFLSDTFGATQITAGQILVGNIETFKEFTKSVTGTTEAQKAAAINSDTLAEKFNQLKDRFVNIITQSDGANFGLSLLKGTLGFLADNLGLVITAVTLLTARVILMSGWIFITETLTTLASVAIGIFTAVTEGSTLAIWSNVIAMRAYNVASAIMTFGTELAFVAVGLFTGSLTAAQAAQWALNAAMAANPIGLIILAVGVLTYLVYKMVDAWDTWGKKVAMFLMPPLYIVMDFIKQWRSLDKTITDGGIIGGIKKVGVIIYDWLLTPIIKLLELTSMLPNWLGGGKSQIALTALTEYRTTLGLADPNAPMNNTETTDKKQVIEKKEFTAEKLISMMQTTERNTIDININDGSGRATIGSNSGAIPISFTNTNFYK